MSKPKDTSQEATNTSPLGSKNQTIQLTHLPGQSTSLFTVRVKDQDLTANQLEAIAHACNYHAFLIRNS